MNKNEILIIIVLCILLILVILQILKIHTNEPFYQNRPNLHHGHIHPFTHDECSSDNYIRLIGDIHVNHNRDALDTHHTHKIHIVHPENPCCLRTCINDFTFTKENVNPDNKLEVEKIGQYKDSINKHLYFASKCNMCLDNFYVGLKRLGSDNNCDESQSTSNKGRSGCERQI